MIGRTAVLCSLLAWPVATRPAAAGQAPLPRQGAAMPVMTDTPEYCARLAAMVHAAQQGAATPREDIDVLAREGLRLCSAGHVRMGVQRLRSAWLRLDSR